MTDPQQWPEPNPADVTSTLARITVPVEEALTWNPLTADDAAAVAALPPHSALLIVQGSSGTSERFLLDADRVLAGRHQKADIFLDDVTVSRKHVEFIRDGDGYRVRDVGSLNGTYVNRDRVDVAPLSSGDEVQIGKFRMTYQASPNKA
ncbi:MAG: FHA domain-containing protein [Cellulomonadaceae bacterium]|jgi:pSer/pThr/pTyr-binding forkhead associated (FHA) protein|nr:FHA domain-containing protein [Cellulomonadaceae bacterium]